MQVIIARKLLKLCEQSSEMYIFPPQTVYFKSETISNTLIMHIVAQAKF